MTPLTCQAKPMIPETGRGVKQYELPGQPPPKSYPTIVLKVTELKDREIAVQYDV